MVSFRAVNIWITPINYQFLTQNYFQIVLFLLIMVERVFIIMLRGAFHGKFV